MDQEPKTDEQLLNEIEVYCDGDAATADLDQFYRREVHRLRQSLNAAELKYTVRLCHIYSFLASFSRALAKRRNGLHRTESWKTFYPPSRKLTWI